MEEMAEMREQLAAAQANQERALERQRIELVGSAKEARVAHLQQQAARRIANAGMASGFSTWQAQWAEAARQKRMLAAAAARLTRPALAAAVAHWRGEWEAALTLTLTQTVAQTLTLTLILTLNLTLTLTLTS